jgi:hypothetical protein
MKFVRRGDHEDACKQPWILAMAMLGGYIVIALWVAIIYTLRKKRVWFPKDLREDVE